MNRERRQRWLLTADRDVCVVGNCSVKAVCSIITRRVKILDAALLYSAGKDAANGTRVGARLKFKTEVSRSQQPARAASGWTECSSRRSLERALIGRKVLVFHRGRRLAAGGWRRHRPREMRIFFVTRLGGHLYLEMIKVSIGGILHTDKIFLKVITFDLWYNLKLALWWDGEVDIGFLW